MILTCPNCYKRYLIDNRSLHIERVVRCAACNHTWRQPSTQDKADKIESLNQDKIDVLEDFSSNTPPSLHKKISLGWLIYIFTWVITLVTLVIIREPLVISFPPLYKIYKILGMNVESPGCGFKIENILTTKKYENNRCFLVIQGDVLNYSPQVKLLTPIHIVYHANENTFPNEKNTKSEKVNSNKLFSWCFSLSQDRLLPGEKISFETVMPMPPANYKGTIYF